MTNIIVKIDNIKKALTNLEDEIQITKIKIYNEYNEWENYITEHFFYKYFINIDKHKITVELKSSYDNLENMLSNIKKLRTACSISETDTISLTIDDAALLAEYLYK